MNGLFLTGWGGQVNVLNAVVQRFIDPWTIEAEAVEEDLGQAEVDCAKGGGIVQIVPLQRKTGRFRLRKEAGSSKEKLVGTKKRLSELPK
jgi:hypothetical protein